MENLAGEFRKQSYNSSVGIVNPSYQKGYKIAAFPYQQYGVLTKVLWASKTQMLRIVPGIDSQTNEICRQIVNADTFSFEEKNKDKYLSNTFVKNNIIEKLGDVGPVIASYPPGSQEAMLNGGETVLRRFVRRCIYSCNGKGGKDTVPATNEMKMWCVPGQSQRITLDKMALMFQALVLHINGRNNQTGQQNARTDLVDAEGRLLPLYALCCVTGSSATALEEALIMPADRRVPPDAQTNNTFGPLAELNGNMLWLNPIQDSRGYWQLDPSVQPAGAQGWTPTPYPLDENFVRATWIPWSQLLNPLTADQQFDLLAEQFSAEAVNYVLGTDSRLGVEIPERIRSVGLGRFANMLGGSVQLVSGIPNSVPAAQGRPAAYPAYQAPAAATPPAFNAQGFTAPAYQQPMAAQAPMAAPAPAPMAAPAPVAAAPAPMAAAPAYPPATQPTPAQTNGIHPLRQPAGTGIQPVSTIDPEAIMRNAAAIRAAAGMGQQNNQQAAAASSLLGGLPSEEDN